MRRGVRKIMKAKKKVSHRKGYQSQKRAEKQSRQLTRTRTQ